jgi:acyl-coenzyme A thioesterase 13
MPHGGLLLTLADIALGYTAEASSGPPRALTTVNITSDFTGRAQVGDWLSAQVDIQKIGRLVFANAYLVVGEERIVRVSAIFARAPASQGRPDVG